MTEAIFHAASQANEKWRSCHAPIDEFAQKGRMTSMRDTLHTIHIVTAVLVLQIGFRITMLLRRLNY